MISHFFVELQNVAAFLGALLAAAIAVMADCGMFAPSDTPLIRWTRKSAFILVAMSLMLAFTYSAFDNSYVPSPPNICLVVAVDMMMVVALVSALRLHVRRHRRTQA